MRKTQVAIVLAVVAVAAFVCYGIGQANGPGSNPWDRTDPQLTVWATVRIQQELLDKSDRVGLVAMSTDDASHHPTLAVQLEKVTKGWFGSFWTLQLVGDTAVLAAPITLLDNPSMQWDGTFKVALGYDATTGEAVVSYANDAGDPLMAARLQLQPVDTTLQPHLPYPTWPLHDGTDDAPVPHMLAGGHYPGLIPFNVPWHITQPTASSGSVGPTTHLHRDLPTTLYVDMAAHALPGTMELHLTASATEAPALTDAPIIRWPMTPGQPNVLPVATLPEGQYRAILQYTLGDHTFTLGEQTIVIGATTVRLHHIQTKRGDNTFHIEGTLVVESDGPLPETAISLQADLIGHPPAYTAPGSGNIVPAATRPVVVATDVPIVAESVHPSGESMAIPFQMDVPLPDGPYRFWELVLRPAMEPDTYSTDATPVSAWIGPDPSAHDWQGYLNNEVIDHTAVAPGIDLYTMRGQIAAGPIQMYLVRADLTNPHVTVDTIIPRYPTWTSDIWPRMPVSEMARHAGAVAGINASYFEISSTMMPRGTALRSGRLLTSAIPGWENVITFTADGSPSIGRWQWQGGVRRPDGTAFRAAYGFNVLHKLNNQLTLYASPPPMKSPGTDTGLDHVVELVVGDVIELDGKATPANERVLRGQVQQVRRGQPGLPLSDDVIVVTGYGTAANYLLDTYGVGDGIDLVLTFTIQSAWPYVHDWRSVHAAVPTGVVLVQNGNYGDTGVRSDPERHPRTAVGFTWDQSTMYWLVVDGRSGTSVGMTYKELADFFLHMGVFHAVNFDGGGSSALAIADPNTGRIRAVNRPSDGGERLVPDGLGLFYTP